MAEISQEELNSRVALLHRFKELLTQQRSKFQEYLTVLEKQQNSIATEDTEHLIAHTELEQQVVKNIASLQKVIIPMQKLYNKSVINSDFTNNYSEITDIQTDLADLQNKVLRQNEVNRELLKVHLDQLKTKMTNLKNPYKNVRSVYADSRPHKVANLISVEV